MSQAEFNNSTFDILSRTGLRASADGVPDAHPDAAVLVLAERCESAAEDADGSYRQAYSSRHRLAEPRADAVARFRDRQAEANEVEAELAETTARTADGVVAKLRAALSSMTGDRHGLARAAMSDAVVLLGG